MAIVGVNYYKNFKDLNMGHPCCKPRRRQQNFIDLAQGAADGVILPIKAVADQVGR